MSKHTERIDLMVNTIQRLVPTFGGGRDSDTNPLAHALKDQPLTFAAGVDVRTIVEFVYCEAKGITLP